MVGSVHTVQFKQLFIHHGYNLNTQDRLDPISASLQFREVAELLVFHFSQKGAKGFKTLQRVFGNISGENMLMFEEPLPVLSQS